MWAAFWRSPIAEVVIPAMDLPAVYRLFTLYDERERAYRAWRKQRLVRGSKGQLVLNPLAAQMNKMDTAIRQLEDRFGLTPKSRAQLGVTFTVAQESSADLNPDLDVDWDDDPRLE
jgi:P27 family predicted phage terminase small subunit